MRNNILIILVYLTLNACSMNAEVTKNNGDTNNSGYYLGDKDNLHVYLLMGQSNMAGRAPLLFKQYNVINNTLLLDGKGHWQFATNPLNRYSSIRKNLSLQKLNIGQSFANTMLQGSSKHSPQVKIGPVVNVKGGSSITEWQPDKLFYKEALRRAKQAQQKGTLKGILWHQGETDFKDPDYLNKLVVLVDNLRTDLNLPELPFVAGQINQAPLINQQVAELPSRSKFTLKKC